jgi:hypothetical protein
MQPLLDLFLVVISIMAIIEKPTDEVNLLHIPQRAPPVSRRDQQAVVFKHEHSTVGHPLAGEFAQRRCCVTVAVNRVQQSRSLLKGAPLSASSKKGRQEIV